MATNISGWKKFIVTGKNFIVKQSPVILAVTAVFGVVTTVGLAIKDTIKAEELVQKRKEELNMEPEQEMDKVEVIKTVWPAYIPTAISTGLTIGAIVASSTIFKKRQAALASLYAMSETALKEYQEKVEEKFGKKKEQEVRDDIAADKAKDIVCAYTDDELTGGLIPIKDYMSNQLFLATVDMVHQAAAEINNLIYGGDMYASLNDFYEILADKGAVNIDPNGSGKAQGWNLQHFCKPYLPAAMSKNGRPILVLDWEPDGEPISDYRDIV